MLYAYAAMKSKCAYVNFTPSVTTEIPALQELAELQAVPTAGKDGRTGQTLYKHVLGKMFKQRGLNIVGWYSTNILGIKMVQFWNTQHILQQKLIRNPLG